MTYPYSSQPPIQLDDSPRSSFSTFPSPSSHFSLPNFPRLAHSFPPTPVTQERYPSSRCYPDTGRTTRQSNSAPVPPLEPTSAQTSSTLALMPAIEQVSLFQRQTRRASKVLLQAQQGGQRELQEQLQTQKVQQQVQQALLLVQAEDNPVSKETVESPSHVDPEDALSEPKRGRKAIRNRRDSVGSLSSLDSFIDEVQYRRGPWTPPEDAILMDWINTRGPTNWIHISSIVKTRTPKQCRERYYQSLRPNIRHEPITAEEGELIMHYVGTIGRRWAEIARKLDGRSDNMVKNWWNGQENKRKNRENRIRNGLDPDSKRGTKRSQSKGQSPPNGVSRRTRKPRNNSKSVSSIATMGGSVSPFLTEAKPSFTTSADLSDTTPASEPVFKTDSHQNMLENHRPTDNVFLNHLAQQEPSSTMNHQLAHTTAAEALSTLRAAPIASMRSSTHNWLHHTAHVAQEMSIPISTPTRLPAHPVSDLRHELPPPTSYLWNDIYTVRPELVTPHEVPVDSRVRLPPVAILIHAIKMGCMEYSGDSQ